MKKLHIYRRPTFNSVLAKMSIKVNDKKIKIKTNQNIVIPINTNVVEITIGKMIWKKQLILRFDDDENKYVTLAFKSKPDGLIDHFRKPKDYINVSETDESNFKKAIENNEELNFVRANISNFIDVATIVLGASVCLLYFSKAESILYLKYLFIGTVGLSAILSVGVRRLSFSKAFSQREALFKTAIFTSISLLLVLVDIDLKAIPLLATANISFWVLWKAMENATYIR